MPRILLVEDNEMNRDMLTRRLERRGFTILSANDGAESLEMALAEAPDLVLMDMGLPVMNGWDATRAIKSDPVGKSIPVIGLTAYSTEEDRQKCLDAGCDEFDTKPVDLQRLLGKIAKFLNVPPEH
jgi:two-component system cell cycle response regulator DivK